MESLKLENLLNIPCHEKMALIHVSQHEIIEQITFEALFKFAGEFKLFLLRNIGHKSTSCIALLMEKNILVPAIIISLQDLNYSFMFLTTKTLVDSVNKLNIEWILSVGIKLPNNNFQLKESLKLSAGEEVQLLFNRNLKQNQTQILDKHNIFCVVQTSGSTGESKTIHVPHVCIENNVMSLNKHFGITSADAIYWGTPLTFDPTLVELILGILNRVTLVIVSKLVALNPTLLYHALFKTGLVTFLQVVPSVFKRWSKQQISDILLKSSLKILAFGGEPFPHEILNYKRKEDLKLFNLYGVTELSCWATIADLSTYSSIENEVPLGLTLDDTFVQIINVEEEVISEGVGEINIGSHTRHCLINDNHQPNSPFLMRTGDLGEWKNGNLYYRGRKNRVIKRFGHRVALQNIENIIFNETGLHSRLVYSANKKLLAFILIEKHFSESPKLKLLDKLKVKLLNILPEHGVPDFVDALTYFPLNKHGKICDKLLEKHYQASLSETLTKRQNSGDIFVDLLSCYLKTNLHGNIEQLGQHNFFELGGNSILAMQFWQTFEEQCNTDGHGELMTLLMNNSICTCLNYVIQNVTISKRKLYHPTTKQPKVLKIPTQQEDCVMWKYDLKGCVDSAPVAFKISDRTYVAAGSFAHTLAVISEDGQEYLRLTLPQEIEAQPSVSKCGNFIFVGCANGVMYSINLVAKQIAWKFATREKIRGSAHLCGTSSVVFGSYDGFIYCVTVTNGVLCWKTELLGSIRADPIWSEELKSIYVGTTKRMCYALNQDSGGVIWNYKVDGPVFGAPGIVGDCIIWPSVTGKLYCTSPTGNIKWIAPVDGHIFSSLAAKNNAIYFGSHDSYLYKISSCDTDYEISRMVKLESETSSSPFLYQYMSKVFVISVCNVGILYVVDESSNTVIFRLQLPAESFSSPFVFNARVYVGCRDDMLYCINIERFLINSV